MMQRSFPRLLRLPRIPRFRTQIRVIREIRDIDNTRPKTLLIQYGCEANKHQRSSYHKGL